VACFNLLKQVWFYELTMSLQHQPEEVIRDRYRVIDILGQGSRGITYRVEDLKTKQKVALKALYLNRLKDWKQIELFEREAEVLAKLQHPAIPQYLDYFQVNTPDNRAFYLAQALAPGKSLFAWVESGWRSKEREVKNIAEQILSVLMYLHALDPPVIHRDIKPQNIIRSRDGKIFLVDFGAVQNTYHNTLMQGSTVVGNYGYMAPEQFRGDWLDKILEPSLEYRYESATETLKVVGIKEAVSQQKKSKTKNDALTQKETLGCLVLGFIAPFSFATNFLDLFL